MKATLCGVVLALLIVPIVTWAQSAPSAAASAPATNQAGVPDSKMPAYFSGLLDDKGNPAPDPTGAKSGAWSDPSGTYDSTKKGDDSIVGDNPAKMSVQDLYDRVVHNQIAINFVWTLVTGFLVMFMQFGFAAVETGLCRAKNAGHTFAMNMMIYPLGCFSFWVYGFAIGWGNWWNGPSAPGWFPSLGPGLSALNSGIVLAGKYGVFGTKGWFLSPSVGDTGVMALFFFMMVFMDTTATIPTGAMAERWSWNNFVLFGLWVAFPYCLFANWVWGGGWLAQMGQNWGLANGACDFAGSGVVHCMGGVIALAGAICVGPRIGKFVDGKVHAIPGHDLPMVMGGTFVLAFGWFGFNPGSTLAGTDLRISFLVVNTMLAGIMGALTAMWTMQLKFGKPDPSMMCNGMLAGLVAITAPSAFVSPLGAVLLGGIAGVLVVFSVFFWDKMGVDDPVGAISVHGVNGAWGVLCVGLFANGDYGAGYNGIPTTVTGIMPIHSVSGAAWFSAQGFHQLGAQCIDVCVLIVTGFAIAFTMFKLTNLVVPLRVSRETELQGLDMPEMGALGYPDFELKTAPSISDVEPATMVKV
jgi:Amt family ammonium transporter